MSFGLRSKKVPGNADRPGGGRRSGDTARCVTPPPVNRGESPVGGVGCAEVEKLDVEETRTRAIDPDVEALKRRKNDMVEKEGRPFPPLDRSADIGDEEELRQASDPVLQVPPPDASMESKLVALVTVAQTEMVIQGPTTLSAQVQNGVIDSTTAIKERKLNFDLKFSVLLITLSMIPLTDILFLRGPTAKLNLILKVSAFFAFTALTSAICLMFQTCKLKAVVNTEQFIPKSQLRVSKILIGFAIGSLFLTCTSITYSLLPKAYYFLPLALLPSFLVGGFHFLYRADNTGNGDISPEQSKARKKELKRATQLTLSLVSTSFTGFVGVLLAIYHKADSLGAVYSYVEVTVYLLLGGSVAGMFALLLFRLLSSNDNHRRQQLGTTTWQRAILDAANIVMAAMLVSAVLMIAETILHGFLAGAMFPVIAGTVAWLLVEFCSVADAHGGHMEEDAMHGTMYAIAVAVASLSFGAILAIFAGLLGGTVSKEQLKPCTFLLASAFVAAVSLGVVTTGTARADKTKVSTQFAVTVLACFGLGTLVLAALALFYQIMA